MKTIAHTYLDAGILTVAIAVALVFFVFPSLTHAATLSRNLVVGSTGTDVTALQTYLAQDSSIYPEGLVTGYFGSLTSAAVARFQTRNNIDAVGVVGPITIPVLNSKMSGISDATMSAGLAGQLDAPAILNVAVMPSGNSATVSWNTNESSKGIVYYSSAPLVLSENVNAIIVSGASATMNDASYRTSQSVGINGLSPNTTYYYAVYSTNQIGNSSMSTAASFRTTN